MSMDKDRELIKQTIFGFLDNVCNAFEVSVSIDNAQYNLALTMLRFFGIEVLPCKFDPCVEQVILHTGSVFTFRYSSIDNRISVVISGNTAWAYAEKYSSKSLDELKEEISEYIDNNSDSNIAQLYYYVIVPSLNYSGIIDMSI